MMIEITVNIQATALVEAINTFAAAIEARNYEFTQAEIARVAAPLQAILEPVNPTPAAIAQPMPTAPAIQTFAANQAPVAAPAPAQIQIQAPIAAPAVPTSAPGYTLEQLAVAATQLVDAGRRAELVQLLGSFGLQALTELPKEHYAGFANQLRAMGAKL